MEKPIPARFRFIPLYFNWVALHPNPIGVVQFIGGAFFGTFPTIFYRYLLRQLFEQGYTIVAIPYRFTLRHWSVAITMVEDRKGLLDALKQEAERFNQQIIPDYSQLRNAMKLEAQKLGYSYKLYEAEPTDETSPYLWLGHSLGCKYIALLELLSELEDKNIRQLLDGCAGEAQAKQIEDSLQGVDFKAISLKNQPSLLMAPAIEGIEGAIPIKSLANLFKALGIDAKPSVEDTRCLIERSSAFGLAGLMTFGSDKIAAETIQWLQPVLEQKGDIIEPTLPKLGHLAPLGFANGNQDISKTAIEVLRRLLEKLNA